VKFQKTVQYNQYNPRELNLALSITTCGKLQMNVFTFQYTYGKECCCPTTLNEMVKFEYITTKILCLWLSAHSAMGPTAKRRTLQIPLFALVNRKLETPS
jgi:hypothetical protein